VSAARAVLAQLESEVFVDALAVMAACEAARLWWEE
jgi:hypothetical protein